MLENTFCHTPRVSVRAEHRLWESGLHSWRHLTEAAELPVLRTRADEIRRYLDDSYTHLRTGNPHFFAGTLPPFLHWRLFPEFRHTIAYLDIETTGLAP